MVLAAEALDGSVSALPSAAAALGRAARPLGELRLRYDALFGHTARGPVCAFETEYGADAPFRQPQELAHIAGYYRAFGLRLGPEGGRADHIACECEFMALLAGREACLGEPGAGREEAAGERAEQVETTRRATRDFLRSHLGRFGLAFGARLCREDGDGLFGAVAQLLVTLLHGDARRFDVTLGPPALELRPPAEDPAPMACGSCPELLGMDRERV
jgi:TorA maturation chaperone TorD